MASQPTGNPPRALAPVALVLATIAFFAVIATSGTDNDNGGSRSERATTAAPRPKRAVPGRVAGARIYTVQTGDTLAGIAQKSGVPIARLQELNPQLDPQALVSGQKIKLRE